MLKKHFRKIRLSLFFFICLLSLEVSAQEKNSVVKKISFNQQNQLEIIVTKKAEFKIFILKAPYRLVVDIAGATLNWSEEDSKFPDFVSSFRFKEDQNALRIVFDLNKEISIKKTRFEKSKNDDNGKIIAELLGANVSFKNSLLSQINKDFILSKVEEFDVETSKINNPDGTSSFIVKKTPKNPVQNLPKKTPIIVIDSGHGGKDPGTIGTFARTKEKNITLSYAKELGKQLLKTKRYKVFLTRSDDVFIPLRQRVEIARKKKADLFISIHANASSNEDTDGFSIYTLSETSSDKQAELLAQKENRADIINGMNFSGASQDIVKTLIDLSQRESKNNSAIFAASAIKSIKNSGINILQNTHRFAGFAVLTAPDMASVLIELGYLSSKKEEKLLNSLSYKRKVAESLTEAIDEYFAKNKS